jgi:hypothetical protein
MKPAPAGFFHAVLTNGMPAFVAAFTTEENQSHGLGAYLYSQWARSQPQVAPHFIIIR